MDKYLIRKEKPTQQPTTSHGQQRRTKQTTIESLARVVVVEDVQRAVAVLSIKEQKPEEIVKCLSELKKRTPSKEVR